ncbi:MAG TPA: TonB family protein [Pyrinomonadaceae bacterium]
MTRLFILVACLFSLTLIGRSQTVEPPNFAEVVQAKIQRARALIAAHQLETAASELESVRASTKDLSVQNIASVMLMNIYLESGNYGRAEALLEEGFRERSARSGDSARTYFALAGQAVNGARLHIARYRSVGISTTDVALPAEAITDLDRLRSFLERLIAQAKEITTEQRAYDSLSLLEDVLGIRLSLAKDAEDQTRWQAEHSSARLLLTSPTQLVSLNGISALPPSKATKKDPSSLPYATRRDEPKPTENAATTTRAVTDSNLGERQSSVQTEPAEAAASDAGPLNARATRKVTPAYPALAKQVGASGLVRVHVIVDETGKVVEVSKSEGHVLLRRVAEDAARQWFFNTNLSDRPSRLSGYIDFNFTL